MRLRARHYRTGRLVDVVCDGSVVRALTDPDTNAPDLAAGWVAPAFCDVQINGCDGISFNSAQLTREQIRHVVGVCRRHGIAHLCPTLVTGPFEALAHGLATLRRAAAEDADLARAVVGVHVE